MIEYSFTEVRKKSVKILVPVRSFAAAETLEVRLALKLHDDNLFRTV